MNDDELLEPDDSRIVRLPDEPFILREGEWNAMCDGKLIAATFNSRGAAMAGISVQRRRNERKSQ